ncbi:DUF4165 domain-containing protein [Vibrio sp. SCSIO 43140]|uniref:Ig-like domain-containing protein n=1 Tax=Vibrio sp. SCSIO 43140 TaxID=2819100 RepID=UPI0020751F64|nr:Ig-like domain-containing protein [Vibrio sp. SCSIO 43140]USD58919.1 DUF4165 domain-containing protein [Vibrio sp. SCSIO 43140]
MYPAVKNLAPLLLFVTCGLQAGLVEFIDDNEVKSISSGSNSYLRSTTPDVVITAGLDRILKVEVKDSYHQLVSQLTTDKIGITDRITTSTGEAYGKIIPLDLSHGDGAYELTFTMLDLHGNAVDVETHSIYLDTVPPSAGAYSWGFNYGRGTADSTGFPIWSPIEAKIIKISNVSDSGSGIEKAWFEMVYRGGSKDGQAFSTGTMDYIADEQAIVLGTGGMYSIDSSYFTREKVDATIRAFVQDKAGNTRRVDQHFHNNGICVSKPVIHAYQDPTSSAVIWGQPNMRLAGTTNHIVQNPLNLIFRMPKNEGRNNNPIYGGGPTNVSHQWLGNDDTYTYVLIQNVSLGTDHKVFWPDIGHTDWYTWRCHPYEVPNPTFTASSAPPKFLGYEAYINGVGWVPNSYDPYVTTGYYSPRNTTLVHLKANVEARSYTQVLIDASQVLCTVPVGATSCIYTPNWPYNTEGQSSHYHRRPSLYKQGTTLRTPTSYVFKYDGSDPIIHDIDSHDVINRRLKFNVTELHTGNSWGAVRLKEAGIIFLDTQSKQEVIRVAGEMSGSGDLNFIDVDYSTFLIEGTYDIYAYAIDNANNESTRSFVTDYELDTTPPTISMLVDGNPYLEGMLVKGLESIAVYLQDESSAHVSSMVLSGGPSDDKVELAYVHNDDDSVTIEYPKLFPALEQGESYTLMVSAKDTYNQAATKTFTFLYEPNNLVRLDAITYLPTEVELYTTQGKPFAIIHSNTLRTENGNIASGKQDLVATVRSDSDAALKIAGEVVQPGETKTIPYVIDNIEGKLNIPLFPKGDNQTDTVSHFSVEIMTIK